MIKAIRLAVVAGLALLAAASVADAGSYRSSYSSSYSRSYSPSYSRSYASPSYSAPRPSVTPSPSSAYRPAASYNVRSTTVTSTYKPSPTASSTTFSRTTAAPSATVINHTTVVHPAPVVVHRYGYPGGYYRSGYDAFWHGYWLSTMFHQPGYGPVYAQPVGAVPGTPVVVAASPWSTAAMVFWIAVAILLIALIIFAIGRAAYADDDYDW